LPEAAIVKIKEWAKRISYGSITLKLNEDAKTVTLTAMWDERIPRTDLSNNGIERPSRPSIRIEKEKV